MAEHTARVWAEEINSPTMWRFTWQFEGDVVEPPDDHLQDVARALRETDGVVEVEHDDGGLIVVIEPEMVTRYQIATRIRQALGAKPAEPLAVIEVARVWAEDLAEDRMRVTWARALEGSDGPGPAERRRVAAWMAAMPGARSVAIDGEGVLVRYYPDLLQRDAIGRTVRDALTDDVPLRQRADDLMHRATTYGNLARKLAMDDRVSPLPEAAKQAVASRGRGASSGAMTRSAALRFIPGAVMISRIQMLLPVLQELSTWSRDADPAIVEEHLSSVGLTRDVLLRDTITAQEMRYYARDFAGDATAELTDRASKGARQALSASRDMLASVRESVNSRNRQTAAGSEHPEQSTKRETSDEPLSD